MSEKYDPVKHYDDGFNDRMAGKPNRYIAASVSDDPAIQDYLRGYADAELRVVEIQRGPRT